MTVSLRRGVMSLMVLLCGSALLLAQQAERPRDQGAQGRQAGQAQSRTQSGRVGAAQTNPQAEQSLVTLLIIGNNKEVALGKLGEQHLKGHREIQEFCQMVQKDHQNFIQQLQEASATSGSRTGARGAAGGGVATLDPAQPTTREPAGSETAATRPQNRQAQQGQSAGRQQAGQSGARITVAKPVIPNTPGSELLQFHQDVAEERLNSTRKHAEQMDENDFALQFMGAQVVAHQEMIDKLEVAKRSASPQLAQVLEKGQETAKEHLEHALKIHKDLAGAGSEERATRGEKAGARGGQQESRQRRTE